MSTQNQFNECKICRHEWWIMTKRLHNNEMAFALKYTQARHSIILSQLTIGHIERETAMIATEEWAAKQYTISIFRLHFDNDDSA